MKKIYLLAIIIVIVVPSVRGQQITIRGTVLNSPEQKVYLSTMYGQRLDSASINREDNSFILKTEIKEETRLNMIYQKKGPSFLNQFIARPGEIIVFNVDLQDLKVHPYINVVGSPGTVEFIALLNNTRPFKLREEVLHSQIDSIRKKNKDTSAVIALEKELHQSQQHVDSIVRRLFDSTQSPINARQMLSFLKGSYLIKKSETDSLTAAIKLRFPDNVSIQALNTNANFTSGQGLGLNTIAPEIILNDQKGSAINSKQVSHKYLLIDFWASWCKPCREENPNMIKTLQDFKSKGFNIFSVSIDTDSKLWKKAIEADDTNSYINVVDTRGFSSAYIKSFGIYALPANFLIDETDKIIAKNLRGDELYKKISELLNK